MTLTDAAADRVRTIMAERADVVGLRIGVTNGGCAGMEYTMDWASEIAPLDEVVEDRGVTVLIEPKAVLFLLGSEMDYVVDKLSAKFVFSNPNQASACGCGESVNLVAATQERLDELRREAHD
ncbi:MAG: iron-sulfur cluster assembly accessory protein [Pseudomonadota bacterium]